MKQETCIKCRGYGLVKMKPISCVQCGGRGKFCMYCENKSGFLIRPFEECEKCYGTGNTYIDNSLETQLNNGNDTEGYDENKCIII